MLLHAEALIGALRSASPNGTGIGGGGGNVGSLDTDEVCSSFGFDHSLSEGGFR
jgi:hypothetical protein